MAHNVDWNERESNIRIDVECELTPPVPADRVGFPGCDGHRVPDVNSGIAQEPEEHGLRRLSAELYWNHFQTSRRGNWPLTQRERNSRSPQRAMEDCLRLVRVCEDIRHENRELKVKASYTISEE